MSHSARKNETQQHLSTGSSGKRLSIDQTVDPYAGQYPPPPLLPPEDLAVEHSLSESHLHQPQPFYFVSQQQKHQHEPSETEITTAASASSATTSHTQSRHNSNSTQRKSRASSYSSFQNRRTRLSSSTQPSDTGQTAEENISDSIQYVRAVDPSNRTLRQEQTSIPSMTSTATHRGRSYQEALASNSEYYDPEAVELREYLKAEREQKLRQEEQQLFGQQTVRLSQHRHSSLPNSMNEIEHHSSSFNRINDRNSSSYQPAYAHPMPVGFASEPMSYVKDNYPPHPSLYENDFLYNNNSLNHYPSDFSVPHMSPQQPPPAPNAYYMGSPFQHSPLPPHHHAAALATEHAFFSQSSSSFPMAASQLHPHHPHRFSLATQDSHPSLLHSPPAQQFTPIMVPTAPAPTTLFEKILTSSKDPYHSSHDDTLTTPYQCCCCFKSPVSFCTFIWILVLFILLGSGVALMIVSKVTGDKCETSEEYKSNNDTVCRQIFHDGLLYGGVAVAGVSGVVILYRFIHWCCRPNPMTQQRQF